MHRVCCILVAVNVMMILVIFAFFCKLNRHSFNFFFNQLVQIGLLERHSLSEVFTVCSVSGFKYYVCRDSGVRNCQSSPELF